MQQPFARFVHKLYAFLGLSMPVLLGCCAFGFCSPPELDCKGAVAPLSTARSSRSMTAGIRSS
jgi:hypothetical protein